MADYRIFQIDKLGQKVGPQHGFTCENDEAAIERSARWLEGRDAELWQHDRLVMRLFPKAK